MDKGHLSERAEKFARKMIKEPEMPDERSHDEKMAEFHKKWEPKRVSEARKAVMR